MDSSDSTENLKRRNDTDTAPPAADLSSSAPEESRTGTVSSASVRDRRESVYSIGHATIPESRQDARDRLESHPRQQETTDAKEAGESVAPAQDEGIKDGKVMGRTKGKIAVIMLALCLAVFLAALDVTIITTALPTISEDFRSAAGYTWIGSAFLLANAASIPSWGKVSDIFGRKPMLLLANIIFMLGSLVAALSNSIGMLIAARAVQGLGGGGLIILVNIVIGDIFPLRIRGAFYGVIGGVWAIASSVGPIVGGAFTQAVSWRWCFWINLPLDGIAFFILLFFLDIKTPRTPLVEGLKAVDWIGTLTVVGGTLMFLFGLQYGGVTAPWDSALVLCLIIFGVFTLAIFLLWEWKGAKFPIMPMAIFSSVTNCATLAIVFLHGYVFISASYYLPLYFQAIRGATPILSGVYLLPTALALAAGSIATGVTIAKTGKFLPPIYFGFFLMTLGFGLFVNFDANSSWAKLIIFQAIAGLGVGPIFQAPIIALQAHIQPRDIGTATATLGFIRQLATTISVVIGEVVYQNELKKKIPSLATVLTPEQLGRVSGGNAGANTEFIDSLPQPQKGAVRVAFADSLQPMWIMYTCFAALGFLTMFLIKRKQLTRQHEETETGIEAEKANRQSRLQEAAEKRASRAASSGEKRTSRFSFRRRRQARPVSEETDDVKSRPTSGVPTEPSPNASWEQDLESNPLPPVPRIPEEHPSTENLSRV